MARSGRWQAGGKGAREAHLAAQAVREVVDEHLACRLLVVRPQVEVVLPDDSLQLERQPARLHALVDAVHLLLQPCLGDVDARDQHGDVTEDRRHHQRACQHRHHRHGRAPPVGLTVLAFAQHHAEGIIQLNQVPLARRQLRESRKVRVRLLAGHDGHRVVGAREPVHEEEDANEHPAEAHQHAGQRGDAE